MLDKFPFLHQNFDRPSIAFFEARMTVLAFSPKLAATAGGRLQ
jgi:hypothetical protein